MGDLATLAKARRELEELYLGIPDESVNLSFQDLAEVKQKGVTAEKKTSNMEPIHELEMKEASGLGKSPSLDFTKGLQASLKGHQHQLEGDGMYASHGHHHIEGERSRHPFRDQHHVDEDNYLDHTTPNNSRRSTGLRDIGERSLAYEDISGMSVASRSPYRSPYQERGRKRPGIPHSNICTICSTYIYIFRHRCLVCGRVYCRDCLIVGMGEMAEGRKCTECLGRRFSQRYIHRAGVTGCCMSYPTMVKQQELRWAEKGPRRSGEKEYNRSGVTSRARNPVPPGTPTRAHHGSSPSFVSGEWEYSRSGMMPRARSPVAPRTPTRVVMSSQHSTYSPTKHPVPY